MVTQIVLGRVYDFGYVVGRWGISGPAFSVPIKAIVGDDDIVYVLSRGYEIISNVPWNRAAGGTRVTKIDMGKQPGDEELLGEYLKYGDADGQLIWPAGIAADSQLNMYLTDEWLSRITVIDKDGNFLRHWGSAGEAEGQLNAPSGIAADQNDDLYIVDGGNHRIQKFTKEGRSLGGWGSFGSDEGQFHSPWGICVDPQGYVLVADYKNHRVQKFTPEGEFVATFGGYGDGRGQLYRPADVEVDPDGDIYVADWGNDRVQVFAPDGRFMTSFIGDAQEISKWGKLTIAANPDYQKRRREVSSLEVEWRLNMPSGVTFDAKKSRLLIADTQRHRLQIYNKVTDYLEPQRNL